MEQGIERKKAGSTSRSVALSVVVGDDLMGRLLRMAEEVRIPRAQIGKVAVERLVEEFERTGQLVLGGKEGE